MEQLIWPCSQQIPPICNSLWGGKKIEIVTTIALSVAVIAVSIFFLNRAEDHRNSLLLDKADSDRVMATDIRSFHDIANLKEINGVAISKIESRARPGKWASSGFLSKEDSLLGVLKKDWKTVSALGTTHIELADHLESIWDISFKNFHNSHIHENLINYNFNSVEGNTINKYSGNQEFDIRMGLTHGMQGDIFVNSTDVNEDGSFWPGEAWGGDIILKNKKNKESVHVTKGIIRYIRKYGFYQGGENNPYRIDPIRLASVFTGHSFCSVASTIKQPCK